jgi:hypothetical protein
MSDSDLVLEIFAGIALFIAGAVSIGFCVKNSCKKKSPTLKQSPSMEELTNVVIEDPST